MPFVTVLRSHQARVCTACRKSLCASTEVEASMLSPTFTPRLSADTSQVAREASVDVEALLSLTTRTAWSCVHCGSHGPVVHLDLSSNHHCGCSGYFTAGAIAADEAVVMGYFAANTLDDLANGGAAETVVEIGGWETNN